MAPGVILSFFHNGEKHEIEVEPDLGLEVLQMQIFSITGVDPEQQQLTNTASKKVVSGASLIAALSEGMVGGEWEVGEWSREEGDSRGEAQHGTQHVAGHVGDHDKEVDARLEDEDRLFAEKLQAEEDAALAASLQEQEASLMQRHLAAAGSAMSAAGGFSQQREAGFRQRLESSYANVLQYEDAIRQQKALSVIPLARLEEEAAMALYREGVASPSEAEMSDALLRPLMLWFKKEFFRWIQEAECLRCSHLKTKPASDFVGAGQPTAEEQKYGGMRVELFRCRGCHSFNRFVRFNDPAKLLETRGGRCGEWANCFTLCCRALGYDAREVVDWTDHVWTECFSKKLGRWIHLDPCEAAFDTPLLYEQGWGKKLSYVVAFSCHGAVDVTRRYTQQWTEVLRRRHDVPESSVLNLTAEISSRARRGLSEQKRAELAARDWAEVLQLQGDALPSGGQQLPGRQSGAEAWRRERGETGSKRREGGRGERESVEEGRGGEREGQGRRAVDSHVGRILSGIGGVMREGVLKLIGKERGERMEGEADAFEVITSSVVDGKERSEFEKREKNSNSGSSSNSRMEEVIESLQRWGTEAAESKEPLKMSPSRLQAVAEFAFFIEQTANDLLELLLALKQLPFKKRRLVVGNCGGEGGERERSEKWRQMVCRSDVAAMLLGMCIEVEESKERQKLTPDSAAAAAPAAAADAADASEAEEEIGLKSRGLAAFQVKHGHESESSCCLQLAIEVLRRMQKGSGRVMRAAKEQLQRSPSAVSLDKTSASTSWQDDVVWLLLLCCSSRVSDLKVAASGENFPNEEMTLAADGLCGTKWLVIGCSFASEEVCPWLQFSWASSSPHLVSHYSLMSADDCPERDVASWLLLGSSDGGESWATLDERERVVFSERYQCRVFEIPLKKRVHVTSLRLLIRGVKGPSDIVQLACFDVYFSA